MAADDRVSILRGAVLPSIDSPGAGEERKMSKAADTGEPASELERLIADLSGSGELVFVFGDGLTTAHLAGPTAPQFRGAAGRRWWHVTLGDGDLYDGERLRPDKLAAWRALRERYGNREEPRVAQGTLLAPAA